MSSLNHDLVLLVDDDEFQLKVFSSYLMEAGFQVITANRGKLGLELARKHLPAMILADYQMPELTGLDFSKEIRQEDALKDCLLLIVTAHECTEDEINAFHDLPDGWINKSEGAEAMVQKVAAWAHLI